MLEKCRGILRRCIVFRPDDASQKRFSWFPDWMQKVAKNVNLIDLVTSFATSIYCLLANIGFNTVGNESSKFAKS